jgi:DNA-binding Lrp family transcriptional regulator
VVDDRHLGKRMTVYIRVSLERQSAAVLGAFEAAVRKCKGIKSCHLMAGQYDYMLVVRVADIDDYGRLHQNELSRLPGVTRLETSFALRDVLEGTKDRRG